MARVLGRSVQRVPADGTGERARVLRDGEARGKKDRKYAAAVLPSPGRDADAGALVAGVAKGHFCELPRKNATWRRGSARVSVGNRDPRRPSSRRSPSPALVSARWSRAVFAGYGERLYHRLDRHVGVPRRRHHRRASDLARAFAGLWAGGGGGRRGHVAREPAVRDGRGHDRHGLARDFDRQPGCRSRGRAGHRRDTPRASPLESGHARSPLSPRLR